MVMTRMIRPPEQEERQMEVVEDGDADTGKEDVGSDEEA